MMPPGAATPTCTTCGRFPSIVFADIIRGPAAIDAQHPPREVKGACILCLLSAVEALHKQASQPAPPPAPVLTSRERQELADLRALVEQLQGEVRDAVVLARAAQAPPAP